MIDDTEGFAVSTPQPGSEFRLNSDKTVAVATDLYWLPMKDAPIGAKIHVLNLGCVATHTVLTEATRKDWKGWQRIPSIPDWMQS